MKRNFSPQLEDICVFRPTLGFVLEFATASIVTMSRIEKSHPTNSALTGLGAISKSIAVGDSAD